MQKIRVYLDNCAYNRPYDNQNDINIRLESEAKLFIQVLRESFDYTEWQRSLYGNIGVKELYNKVTSSETPHSC